MYKRAASIMKKSAVVVLLLLYVALLVSARHINSRSPYSLEKSGGSDGRKKMREESGGEMRKFKRGETVEEVAGSRLPDCSHACGSCSPCRLVMVSFVCASLQDAETCPMAYKCMCQDKSYPVP